MYRNGTSPGYNKSGKNKNLLLLITKSLLMAHGYIIIAETNFYVYYIYKFVCKIKNKTLLIICIDDGNA